VRDPCGSNPKWDKDNEFYFVAKPVDELILSLKIFNKDKTSTTTATTTTATTDDPNQ
jgi:hypothetical protein